VQALVAVSQPHKLKHQEKQRSDNTIERIKKYTLEQLNRAESGISELSMYQTRMNLNKNK
jgi:hypothetical protein